MILADSSAWIEYDRETGSAVDERVAELIATDGDLAVTGPVMMEVLAGARDERRAGDLLRLLGRFAHLPFEAVSDFHAAATIYRRCRAVGVTPRGMLDCMIAAVAWSHGATLLSYDIDLDRVAQVIGVPLDDASLRA